jgi:hypothetical protein
MSPSAPPVGPDVEIVRVPSALLPTTKVLIVVPVIAPPEIDTLLAFCVDIVPRLAAATALVTAVCTNAVVAICVVLVVLDAVGAAGVPVNVGDAVSALVEIAVAMLLYSVSISVPLIILAGLPVSSASLDAKSVAFT